MTDQITITRDEFARLARDLSGAELRDHLAVNEFGFGVREWGREIGIGASNISDHVRASRSIADLHSTLDEIDEENTKFIPDLRDVNQVAFEDDSLVVFVDRDGTELYETAVAHGIEQEDLLAHMHRLVPPSVDAVWNSATPFVVLKD